MKYHIAVKSLALLLATVCLVTVLLCGGGILLFTEFGVYDDADARTQEQLNHFANILVREYVGANSNVPKALLLEYGYSGVIGGSTEWVDADYLSYAIYEEDSLLLKKPDFDSFSGASYTFTVSTLRPIAQSPEEPEPLVWVDTPAYRVELIVAQSAIRAPENFPDSYFLWAFSVRNTILYLLVGSIVLFGVCAIYLCCAAGRSPGTDEIRPGGLNRLPLDGYAAIVALGCFLLAGLLVDGIGELIINEPSGTVNPSMATLAVLMLLAGVGMILGWLFALAAQFKAGGLFWWHHSVIGWCVDVLRKLLRYSLRQIKRLTRRLGQIFRLVPFYWQRVLVLGGLFFCILLMHVTRWSDSHWFFLLLTPLVWLAAVGYDLYAFGLLMRGGKRMAGGDLDTPIPTRGLLGAYRDHARCLNAMADVATVAAQQQMKSERLKAELITNVSHDIKTPLTSLINYVDLLQQPHTPQEQSMYLDVLSRQSVRMKKLLEDLIEMSKAATGNISVEIARMSAVEAVNQALGEFNDKLAAAQLIPVFDPPEHPAFILADGKATWRVLSNLLSNVVKYALPGTRVYLDLQQQDRMLALSVKNISREALNVDARELTERFVRGDSSRSTEGSGLGLNIAKSLMELQKGALELTVDGDLFKVTLYFPIA